MSSLDLCFFQQDRQELQSIAFPRQQTLRLDKWTLLLGTKVGEHHCREAQFIKYPHSADCNLHCHVTSLQFVISIDVELRVSRTGVDDEYYFLWSKCECWGSQINCPLPHPPANTVLVYFCCEVYTCVGWVLPVTLRGPTDPRTQNQITASALTLNFLAFWGLRQSHNVSLTLGFFFCGLIFLKAVNYFQRM